MDFDSDDLLELEKYLQQNNISKDKVCLVGSATLSLLGIRRNDDIDIVVHSSSRLNLTQHKLIQVVKSPWSTLCSDDTLIEDPQFHIIYNGWKFIRPELLYHRKAWHNRPKDIVDICDLHEYAAMDINWNWQIIKEDLPMKSNFKKFLLRVKNKIVSFFYFFKNIIYTNNSLHSDCYQMVATNFLLSKQVVDGNFNRFDIFVRYLAIQSFFNGDRFGTDLYNRMQERRNGTTFINPWKHFKYLIRSFDIYGYDYNYPVLVNDDLHIVDGAHRLACALYFRVPFLVVKVNKKLNYSRYGVSWFRDNNFLSDEITLLNQHKDKLFLKNNLYFEIVLWPSVEEYFDEIELDISRDFQILLSSSYNNIKNFNEFVRCLYKIDDIKDWKVDMKIKEFDKYKKNVRILKVVINDPEFRRKHNGRLISKKVEDLKSSIRGKYSARVPDYFHDIIIHIGDNYEHSRLSQNLIDA